MLAPRWHHLYVRHTSHRVIGVKSLLVVKGFEMADKQQKLTLKKYVGKADLTQLEAEEVLSIITSVGAKAYCEQMLLEKGTQARHILDNIRTKISHNSYEYLDDLLSVRLGLN